MTDWASRYAGSGGSSGGSSAWASRYGGGGGGGGWVNVGAPSGGGGGGGFFGSIEHALGTVASPVANFGLDIGRGVYNLGKASAETALIAQGDPWRAISRPDTLPLYTDVARPVAKGYAAKYGAVFEHPLSAKSWETVGSNIVHDPVGSALDAATIAAVPFTGGESAVLRGATLASRIAPEAALTARLAKGAESINEARTLTRTAQLAKGDLPTDYTIARARTPAGILGQKAYLKVAEHPAIADRPLIGAAKYVGRNFQEKLFLKQAGQRALLGKFERSIPLGRAEQAALHIAAQAPRDVARSDWRKVFEDFYRSRSADEALPRTARADAARMVKIVGGDNPRLAAKIDQVITNPSARWQKFYDAARNVSEQTTKAIGTSAADAADRAVRPADVLAGTHWQSGASERLPRVDQFATDRRAMTTEARQAEAKLRVAVRRETSLRERVRSYQGRLDRVGDKAPGALKSNTIRAKKALMQATKDVEEAKRGSAFLSEGVQRIPEATPSRVIKTEGEFVGPHAGTEGAFSQYAKATEAENPLGKPFIFSHLGPSMPRSNAVSLAKTTMPAGKIAKTSIQHFSKQIRFQMGRYMTNPTALTRAGMMAFRTDAAKMFQDWLHGHAIDIPESGVPAGWRRFEPTASKIDRATKERGQQLGEGLTQSEHADLLHAHWEEVLPKTSTTAHLMVPNSLARQVEQEFAKNGKWMGKIFDNAVALWRAAVLKYRPAWLANNILGQHFLYWLHNASPAGMASFIQAMRLEKGDTAARNFVERALRDPAIRSKYKNVLEEQGLHGVNVGSTNALLRKNPEEYSTTRIGLRREANPKTAMAIGAIPKTVRALTNTTAFLNQHLADDWPRVAMYLKLARASPAAFRAQQRMLQVAKDTGESMSLMRRFMGAKTEDVLKEVTPEEHIALLRQVNKALGNFNALGPLERRVLRRYFPFVAWFKVITTITKDLAVDNPQKLLFLKNLEVAANQNPGLLPAGPMPSWLQGAIAIGPSQGGVQPLLSTQGVNPFATDVQLGRAVGNTLVGGGQPSDTTGLFGPWFSALQLALGKDPATGDTYRGPAANQPPLVRALLGTLGGLPQYQLYQNRGGSSPTSIYANTGQDYLAQYLGLPRRRVKVSQANQYAQQGR